MQDLTGGVRGTGLFPDNVVHLGGDEVNTACYESTPSIAKWLKQKGLTADGGYEDFVKKYQAIAHSKGRDVAGWEEIWFEHIDGTNEYMFRSTHHHYIKITQAGDLTAQFNDDGSSEMRWRFVIFSDS